MESLLLYMLLCLLMVLAYFLHFKRKTIPGPKGLPFLGNSLQVSAENLHHKFTSWAKEYGDLYALNLLGRQVVVVSGEETIREVLVNNSLHFADRMPSFSAEYCFEHAPNLFFVSYTQRVREMKKYLLRTLKMYGEGLHKLEEVSLDIIDDLILLWNKKCGMAFNPESEITEAVTNILLSIVFGKKLLHSDPRLKKITYTQNVLVPEIFIGSAVFLDRFPWLRKLGFFKDLFSKIVFFREDFIEGILKEMLEEHRQTYDPLENKCLMDTLLRDHASPNANPVIKDENLIGMQLEIIGAGTSSTIPTLMCMLTIFVAHQDIQTDLRNYIVKEIGYRKPRLEDRALLPLIDSFIWELLRYHSVVPLGVAHCTTQDTKIGNMPVSKGVMVWPNLWALHHDKRYWDEPWKIKPDRFLDENGHLLPPDHPMRRRLLPFGGGHRMCAGDVLARNRLFLFIVSLLQHFRFLPAAELPKWDPRDYKLGFTIHPTSFNMKIEQIDWNSQ